MADYIITDAALFLEKLSNEYKDNPSKVKKLTTIAKLNRKLNQVIKELAGTGTLQEKIDGLLPFMNEYLPEYFDPQDSSFPGIELRRFDKVLYDARCLIQKWQHALIVQNSDKVLLIKQKATSYSSLSTEDKDLLDNDISEQARKMLGNVAARKKKRIDLLIKQVESVNGNRIYPRNILLEAIRANTILSVSKSMFMHKGAKKRKRNDQAPPQPSPAQRAQAQIEEAKVATAENLPVRVDGNVQWQGEPAQDNSAQPAPQPAQHQDIPAQPAQAQNTVQPPQAASSSRRQPERAAAQRANANNNEDNSSESEDDQNDNEAEDPTFHPENMM